MALLPGSPAIDKGSNSLIPSGVTTDQRGVRSIVNSTVDIGAVESQGYTLAVTGGNSQTTNATTAFSSPLAVTVAPINASDPVNGGLVTFAAPGRGRRLTPSTTSATIASGSASVTATANNTVGTFNGRARRPAGPTAPASFSLTNVSQPGGEQPDRHTRRR